MSLKSNFRKLWRILLQYHFRNDNNRQHRRLAISVGLLIAFLCVMTAMIWVNYEEYSLITHRREMLETSDGITEIDPGLIT